MLSDTDYAYSVAYMRTIENKMLKSTDIDAIMQSGGVGDAVKYLEDKGYAGIDVGAGGIGKADIDGMLKETLEYAWNEIRDAAPKQAPLDILLYQNDFQNLKTIMKAVFSGGDYKELIMEPYTVEPQLIYDAVSENKLDELPDALRGPARQAYEVLAGTNDGQMAEIVIDKATFGAMQKVADATKNAFLKGWVELWATLTDMKTALRGAASGKSKDFLLKALIPVQTLDVEKLADAGAQDGAAVIQYFSEINMEDAAEAAQSSISDFEKWSDNQQMEYIKTIQNNTFGFEPLLGFLYGKRVEIQAVRIVLYGILNHVSRDVIKERLRELYV